MHKILRYVRMNDKLPEKRNWPKQGTLPGSGILSAA
jgi:hypothetical protein